MKRLKLIVLVIVVSIGSIITYFYFFLPIPSFELERLYLKEIKDSNLTIGWFFYSSAFAESPDYITLEVGNNIDTICIANNIADLKYENDTIIICFYGYPQRYSKHIEVPDRLMGYEIIVDSTYITDAATDVRYRYTKDN
jgi:hypothetical protein